MRRFLFDLRYRFGRTPWDTGVPPPELVAFVEHEPRTPGHAIDLGCGTGTNVLYLARHGWDAVGVDFARSAIEEARRRARCDPAAARTRFIVADVAALPDLGPFDLALDMGCLHSLAADARPRYADGVARVLRPGATYLLYAFCPAPGRSGLAREEVERLLGDTFALLHFEEGTGRPSAWYRFTRRAS